MQEQEKNDPQQHGDPGSQGTRTAPTSGEGQHKSSKHREHDEASRAHENDPQTHSTDAGHSRT